MTKISITVLFMLVLGSIVLVTEGRSALALDQEETFSDDTEEEATEDSEEFRFLTGIGNGGSTATAINNWITQQQQALEALRPQGGTSSTSAGANVIYVNAGASTGTSSSSASSLPGPNVAGLIIPQVIQAAVGGRRGAPRRRRRPSNNRNRNRNRKRGSPQVFLVRP